MARNRQFDDSGPGPPPKFEPALSRGDRLTVHLTVHHEHISAEPITAQAHFDTILETQEQPYVRRLTISEEWTPLDFQWLKDSSGFVLVTNTAGTRPVVNPTEEEQAQIDASILELAVGGPDATPFTVRPGRFFIAELPPGAQLFARGQVPDVPINLTVFPR